MIRRFPVQFTAKKLSFVVGTLMSFCMVGFAGMLFSGTGCGGALGGECILDSDCTGGLVCAYQFCHQRCNTTVDCAGMDPSAECIIGHETSKGPYRYCAKPAECQRNVDCGSGRVCVDPKLGNPVAFDGGFDAGVVDSGAGTCRDSCRTNEDCLEPAVCARGFCREFPDAGVLLDAGVDPDTGAPLWDETPADQGGPCTNNSHCLSQNCKESICLGCQTDNDCQYGRVCEFGVAGGECVFVNAGPCDVGTGGAGGIGGSSSGGMGGAGGMGSGSSSSGTGGSIDSGLVINEVDYDQPQYDTAEYVEIYNGTSNSVDFKNYELVFVNGATTTWYCRFDLNWVGWLPPGWYLLIVREGDTKNVMSLGSNWIGLTLPNSCSGGPFQVQNGGSDGNMAGDGIALMQKMPNIVIDSIWYETELSDGGPGLNGWEFTSIGDDGANPNESICRYPNGQDSGDGALDWHLCKSTPGGANELAP